MKLVREGKESEMLKVAAMWFMVVLGAKDGEMVEKMHRMKSLEACQERASAVFDAAYHDKLLVYNVMCMNQRMYDIYKEEDSI